MPAVNTLVIHRADMFGLGQLYQLRGRVGRGKQRGYAYLTWPPNHRLSAAAREAADGDADAGQRWAPASRWPATTSTSAAPATCWATSSPAISARSASSCTSRCWRTRSPKCAPARAARGGQERDWTPNISLGLPVLIPEDYVRDLPVRLGLYRRIGALASDAETEAMAAELVDRFGPLPAEVENLLQVVALKRACREAGVEKLEAGPKGMVLSFRGNAFSNPAGLVAWLASKGGLVRLRPDHKLAISREMDVATRLRFARDTLGNLERISGQAKAA